MTHDVKHCNKSVAKSVAKRKKSPRPVKAEGW